MEKRKEKLSTLKVCRFCLTESNPLENLYEKNQTSKDSVNLHIKILTCVAVEVFPSDKMPRYICKRCSFLMKMFYDYKRIVRQTDENILQYIQNGSALEPITWPSVLVKAFKSSNEMGVMKTIVEGGATVQVSSQDASDSEEEEGANVYNVKIGDDADGDGKTTCIKVVPAKDNQDSMEDSVESKVFDTELEDRTAEKNLSPGIGDRCWPCDECDCTYPLQQLLDLHKKQKHRARNVQCDKCDAKFFNKYDLSTHLLRHSDEMPFQCVACGKNFKRNILLKRHEKLIHSDLPQHMCPNCPASFLSIEQCKEHVKKHVRVPKPYECSLCDKKFIDKALLQRHKDAVHNKTLSFHCEYCPERFSSVTKLARHVRGHAGERPYPCKYCHKSFTKSHHYTRHLRIKHRDAVRSSNDAGEQYRCDQCDVMFTTQDELIYHSAIHATQSLTCPLCQERFGDVDAVTAHIKSHVTGEEFMCEYCELVFTAKEKLDNHMMIAHEEELQQELQDDSEMEVDEEDEDNGINVKEVDENNMVIEIKKPSEFLIKGSQCKIQEEKVDNTNSEESEVEGAYAELPAAETVPVIKKQSTIKILSEKTIYKPAEVTVASASPKESPDLVVTKNNTQIVDIVYKNQEAKPLQQQTLDTMITRKEKPLMKSESSGGVGDKSLKLLEKELQDLKRTNSRNDVAKTPAKPEMTKGRRPQLHTSTPKLKSGEEKKTSTKPLLPKKVPTKENKEPKEIKESKNNGNGNNKEDKETPKAGLTISLVKNGSNDKSTDEGIRRSTRPSKIKNYAKMIRDKPQAGSDDDSEDDDDEEYKEVENRPRGRRPSLKQTPKQSTPAATPTATPTLAATPTPTRKRGRPRKEPQMPAKMKRESEESEEEIRVKKEVKIENELKDSLTSEGSNSITETKSPGVLVYPGGQTLKKVPVKALPPGVKPLPLPANARSIASGDLCEMQIGKKVVKVQKIVMTRAEVEAMAKKGLVEMKDGTMVLKQGIKLPTVDSASIKSTLVGEADVSSDTAPKLMKAAPTRCDIDDS